MKISNNLSFQRALLLPLALAFILLLVNVDAAPYQELAPRKGWIPVYIRHGDTPLSEINPKLAEAFHEDEINAAAPEIESADLKLEQVVTTAATTETPKISTEDSDIASFDVVKGDSDAEKS